jgi:hypothetical protein
MIRAYINATTKAVTRAVIPGFTRFIPSLSTSAISSTQIKLDWTIYSVQGLQGFSIERSDDGILFSEVDTVSKDTLTYTDTVSQDVFYYYRVRAYNVSRYYNYSNISHNAIMSVTKNLWAHDDSLMGVAYKGITITHNTDGSYTVNGTATGEDHFKFVPLNTGNPYITFLNGSKYTIELFYLSGTHSGTDDNKISCGSTSNMMYLPLIKSTDRWCDSITTDFTSEKYATFFSLYIHTGVTFDNYTFKVNVYEGDELITYHIPENITVDYLSLDDYKSNISLPSAVISEVDTVVGQVNAIDADLRFFFQTDNHETNNRGLYGLYQLVDSYDICDFLCNGGDMHENPSNTATLGGAISGLTRISEIMKNIDGTFVAVKGNHDAVPNEALPVLINGDVFNNIFLSHLNNIAVFDPNNPNGNYYYIDFNTSKIRVVFINTSDVIADNGELVASGPDLNIIQQKQIDWITNVALNFTNKSDRSEWHLLTIGHAPLIYFDTSLLKILQAFKSGGAYSGADITMYPPYTVDVDADYTEQGAMIYVGNICGHLHNDTIYTNEQMGFTEFRVRNAFRPYDEAGATGRGQLDTPDFYSFDIISISKLERKLYETRFGAGEDRCFTY